MTFKERHQKHLIAARKENLKMLRKEINQKWVTDKIKNYLSRYDIQNRTIEDIRQRIKIDDEFAWFFIKEPLKQGCSEKDMLKMLKVDKLSQKAPDAICFDLNGNIVHDPNGIGVSKAADCIINGCYATLKYTEGSGGAQDNQRRDVENFLINASKTHKVYAILEGSYYDNGHRREMQIKFKDNPNVIITNIDGVLGDEKNE